MAEAALRIGRDFDTDVVRRLMSRPIRVRPETRVAPPVSPAREPAPEPAAPPDEAAGPSEDVARLRSEVLVMKAVLRAEREETANLRASIERFAGPAPMSEEARAVRDRWAALVDQILDAPR